jgi:hypothetical protein
MAKPSYKRPVRRSSPHIERRGFHYVEQRTNYLGAASEFEVFAFQNNSTILFEDNSSMGFGGAVDNTPILPESVFIDPEGSAWLFDNDEYVEADS